jgi:hypothetical protein
VRRPGTTAPSPRSHLPFLPSTRHTSSPFYSPWSACRSSESTSPVTRLSGVDAPFSGQPSELLEKIVSTAGWYTVALFSVDVSNQVVDLNLCGTPATINDSKYILTRIILKRLFAEVKIGARRIRDGHARRRALPEPIDSQLPVKRPLLIVPVYWQPVAGSRKPGNGLRSPISV